MLDLPAICGSISVPRNVDRAERRNDDFLQVRRFRVFQQEDSLTDNLPYKAYFVSGKNLPN